MFLKKSLGQHFLIDKNIIRKIINLTNINNKDLIEIGPGNGALTDEIIKKKPKSLILLEKDTRLANILTQKYSKYRSVKVLNMDILKFDFANLKKKKLILFGNLPYNISSQILIKILKCQKLETKFSKLILMFQKELAEKIIGKFQSSNYGRLSIITSLKTSLEKKFLVTANCFFPKPKVTSMVIFLKTLNKNKNKIKIENLEKVTNIIFSSRRKMINKSIKKLINKVKLKKLNDLDLSLRPENLQPEYYYKITKIYEEN